MLLFVIVTGVVVFFFLLLVLGVGLAGESGGFLERKMGRGKQLALGVMVC